MSKEQCVNKKLHPYYKTGVYAWIGEEVDDNDYIICPICGEVLGMNYCDYAGEQGYDNKCPKCKQELDYSEIYDFEDTCYFEQLLKIKDSQISDLEAKLAEKDEEIKQLKKLKETLEKARQREVIIHQNYRQGYIKDLQEINELQEENRQLKQSQKQLALEVLEKMREKFGYRYNSQLVISSKYLSDFIDNQIKELKGEE